MVEKRTNFNVTKVDDNLGLVFGYAIVCLEKGVPYYDLQGDHIPEDVMLKAACDFMLHSRTAKEMHKGDAAGSIVFAWPMTSEIAKAFGLEVEKTGLMVAMRPTADILAKFRDGTYKGFSIGGECYRIEEVEG